MIGKLKTTLRGWVGRYGSEAAFVGRVALAALLPPGGDRLLTHGLEAAFEYLQGKSDVISDHDLLAHLDRLGVPHGELNEAVSRIDQEGQVALDKAYQAPLQLLAAPRSGSSFPWPSQLALRLISLALDLDFHCLRNRPVGPTYLQVRDSSLNSYCPEFSLLGELPGMIFTTGRI